MKYLVLILTVIFSARLDAGELIIEMLGADTEPKQYTLQQLADMPAIEYRTHSPWFEGEANFKGVSLLALLQHVVGSVPARVMLRALNDYSVEVSGEDIKQYQPIIAYQRDGEPMAIRHKGPFWLIYPLADFPELENDYYYAQMIWQLEKIQIVQAN